MGKQVWILMVAQKRSYCLRIQILVKYWLIVWAHGSVVERVPDKNEVHGSIPCAPTSKFVSPFVLRTARSCSLTDYVSVRTRS